MLKSRILIYLSQIKFVKKNQKKIIEFTYNKELAVMKKYSHHSNNTNKPSFWPKKRGQRLSVVQKRL